MYSIDDVAKTDKDIADLIEAELARQNSHIELIASENWVSKAVMAAMGSPLTNKYAEGYPGKRFYGGCSCVDEVEALAIERAKELFGCEYANVQPHSGAQANMAVFFAMLQPGDTVMGMNLDHGGHLTHGSAANMSIGGNIRRFVARRTDLEAAEAMLTGSLFAGIAFSFARLGNIHAMSHPVSAFFNVAHGVANAVLLPVIAEYNALADHGRYLKIYNYISQIPAYEDEFEPLMLVDAIRELNEDIGIPEDLTTAIRQAKKGEEISDEEIESKIDAMADDAMKSGNIAVNPRSSRKQDIVELYHKAL